MQCTVGFRISLQTETLGHSETFKARATPFFFFPSWNKVLIYTFTWSIHCSTHGNKEDMVENIPLFPNPAWGSLYKAGWHKASTSLTYAATLATKTDCWTVHHWERFPRESLFKPTNQQLGLVGESHFLEKKYWRGSISFMFGRKHLPLNQFVQRTHAAFLPFHTILIFGRQERRVSLPSHTIIMVQDVLLTCVPYNPLFLFPLVE